MVARMAGVPVVGADNSPEAQFVNLRGNRLFSL
jgi:hypothetical protein